MLLSAILLLSNIQCIKADVRDVSAKLVVNVHMLEQVAQLLGMSPDKLTHTLTIRQIMSTMLIYTVVLNIEQSMMQWDQFMQDLYAIIFSFVIETTNHNISPAITEETVPATQIYYSWLAACVPKS